MIKNLLVFLDNHQFRQLALVLAADLVASVLEMVGIGIVPAFVSLLVDPDRLLSALPESPLADWIQRIDGTTRALYGAALLAGLFLVKNLYLVLLIFVETWLMQNATASVSSRLFRAYLYSPYTLHLQRNPAELSRNLIDETIHAAQFVKAGMRLIREGLVLVVVFLLMVLVDPLVSLSAFSLLALASGGFYLVVQGALAKRSQHSQDHACRQFQVINQSLGAIKEAKILGREPYLMEQFHKEVRGLSRNETFYDVISSLPRHFLEVLSIAAILPMSAAFVLLDRPVQSMLPILALFGVAVVRLVPAINSINMALVDIRYKRPAFDLVCAELVTLESPIMQGSLVSADRHPTTQMQQGIRLENVRYRYPDAEAEAIPGLSLEIRAGEVVAFIGPSGAGKSTVIDLIVGLLTPTAGLVCVDGHDIRRNLSAWQRQIGYIPQEIYLNDDTIRRNIAFGLPDDQIDDMAVAHALHAAQLEEFVRSLPEGFDTLVGNQGIRLSGGQRQRIAIARALYHDPRVLVMDEATNALDNETEGDVMEAVRALRGEKTFIIVAHRPSTVENCDRLFRLDHGRIVHATGAAAVPDEPARRIA